MVTRTPAQISGRTMDYLILILGVTVGVVIVTATVATLVIKAENPEWDGAQIISIVDAQVSVIVGALVGLIAGQASARMERQRIDADTADRVREADAQAQRDEDGEGGFPAT